jgi:hypothetical protein
MGKNRYKIDKPDIFANHFSSPGTARSAFEYFRAFPVDAEQNIE